ncbi:MAG: mevalonate kinase [Anaerolineaceae bacterium]|nr:mevalonate kinase [Anaerolineaceae bacterium]
MPAISSSAPGKMILCGEHAVVYYQPAIAIPVLSRATTTIIFAHPLDSTGKVFIHSEEANLHECLTDLPTEHPVRQTIELVQTHFRLDHLPACEIRIHSNLPISAGLGSSASLSISILRALSEFLGQPLSLEQINQLAYEAEKIHHGNPSGVDNTVIAYGRPVYFIRGKQPEFVRVKTKLSFLLAHTGIAASTSKAVAEVREHFKAEPQKYSRLFSEIGVLTNQNREFLASGEIHPLGKNLTHNHKLLQEMGVSSTELDQLVSVALGAGAYGAKLSGGGQGGNMLALIPAELSAELTQTLLSAGAKSVIALDLPASGEEQ